MAGIIHRIFRRSPILKHEAAAAYDIWANNYDEQPGNLMLQFDEEVFSNLIGKVDLTGKAVADIGCGTGRHWNKIWANKPGSLIGFDVSTQMLKKLKEKYPFATTYKIGDNQFKTVKDSSFDVIVSTLTIAHIQNLGEALKAWSRILKPAGQLIVTDFHPAALSLGGKRTFKADGRIVSVTNYIHSLKTIQRLLSNLDFTVISMEEKVVNEDVKYYYLQQNALPVYDRFKEVPMLYGMLLKKIG